MVSCSSLVCSQGRFLPSAIGSFVPLPSPPFMFACHFHLLGQQSEAALQTPEPELHLCAGQISNDLRLMIE